MPKRVDLAIAFFGKPMQTIIAIKSILEYSGEHIDKIYLTHEQQQPHGDWSGIHKVIQYFRKEPVQLIVQRPHYFLAPNAGDVPQTRHNARYRQSIMYQYALEKSDKPYVCVLHNDMLFHGDMVGDMLKAYDEQPDLAATGPIGQCWSCPASVFFGKKCSSTTMTQYRPGETEAVALHEAYATPRQALDIEIIKAGRVHPLPECRVNEYCALINVNTYRKTSLPVGDIGCYGGGWNGADLGTVWFHDMFNRGYTFRHFDLSDYAKHAPFDDSGGGSIAYSHSDRYWNAERMATDYINANYPVKTQFGPEVWINTTLDTARRQSWLATIRLYGLAKKLAGR